MSCKYFSAHQSIWTRKEPSRSDTLKKLGPRTRLLKILIQVDYGWNQRIHILHHYGSPEQGLDLDYMLEEQVFALEIHFYFYRVCMVSEFYFL